MDNNNKYLCTLCSLDFNSQQEGLRHVYNHYQICRICNSLIDGEKHYKSNRHLISEIKLLLDSNIGLKYKITNSNFYKNCIDKGKYEELYKIILRYKLKL